MNQPPSYMDVGQGHMSHSSVSSSTSAPPLSHYSSYQQHQPMQNGVHPYASSPVQFPQYGGYTNGIPSLHSAGSSSGSISNQLVQQSPIPLPSLPTSTSLVPAGGQPSSTGDLTGQVAPPGMKPRVTATLWEDEGSLCFQVEAAGVCVARREDNHMINGTKLLNVAGMTRGRRDGILKSEKTRHVVKIGPMHLKGVWIPFERALDFANKEKITEQLYPLFVHNIGALLYHPQNNARKSISGATMAAADRKQPNGQHEYMRTPQSSTQPPVLHHSMTNPVGAHGSQPPPSIAPHPSGRPGLDRAHTFPTPPTSASSMMGMGNPGATYEWGGAPVSSSVQTSQPLSIDTSMSNNRSVPTTPATTPPGNSMPSMQHYQTSGSYDPSRQMYSASSQPSHYGSQYGMSRFNPSPRIKNEMGPPARVGNEADHGIDGKQRDMYNAHPQEHPPSSDAEGEHEGEYTHSAGPYGQSRGSYGYSSHQTPTSIHSDHSQVSPEMIGSPHHKGTGRATPRAATNYAGYSTPYRAQPLPSSNLYNVMSENRNGPNGAEMYNTGYPSQSFQPSNGPPTTNKRSLDSDDSEEHSNGLKRQRTVREDSAGLGDRGLNRPRPMAAHKKR